jgi:hypothetical protein
VIVGVEELLHAAGGGVGNEEASVGFADEGEGMGDTAGAENRVAGFEVVELAADLDDVLAFDDVEPLVFDVVDVAGRAAFLGVVVFHSEEVAAAVFGGDFEGGGSVGEIALEVVTIPSIADGRDGGRSRRAGRSRGRGLERFGEEAGRK